MTFKVGDVVSLRSGGGSMTVESVDGDKVVCCWFDGKNIKKETLLAATLTEGDGTVEWELERLERIEKKPPQK